MSSSLRSRWVIRRIQQHMVSDVVWLKGSMDDAGRRATAHSCKGMESAVKEIINASQGAIGMARESQPQ
eukprot:68654-Chlamydomonas_euryale.AAC.5